MKKKEQGFTLIEILTVVAIIGILAVIAIVSVAKTINKAKEEHYKTLEKTLMLAGQGYAQENRNSLPKTIGQKTVIPFSTLKGENYINVLTDYNNEKCYEEKSFVQVYKYSESNYSYLPYLECPNYKTNMSSKEYIPVIEIDFKGAQKKDAKVDITITDDNKIMSYSYTIYREETEVKSSGDLIPTDNNIKITKTLELSDYAPGKIKVVVSATNLYGNSKSEVATYTYQDKESPTCVIEDVDQKDNPKEWINTGERTITVGCSDGDGIGCTKETYVKTFTDTTKIGKITIQDKSGNKTDCEVSVYIDKEKPTTPELKISGTSTLTIEMESSDTPSGISHFEYRPLNSTGTYSKFSETGKEKITVTTSSTYEIRAVDYAGNTSEPAYTRHCNTSGGTLKYDSSLGYICVKESILIEDTCEEEYDTTCDYNQPVGSTSPATSAACKKNINPWSWWCSTGWAGAQCYITTQIPCVKTREVACDVAGCEDGFEWYEHEVSCYKEAD